MHRETLNYKRNSIIRIARNINKNFSEYKSYYFIRLYKKYLKKYTPSFINVLLKYAYKYLEIIRFNFTGNCNINDLYILKYFISKNINLNNNKKNILFIFPWTIIGGAEKFNIDILEAIKDQGYGLHIITTVKTNHVWHNKFSLNTKNIYHLDKICNISLYFQFINEYIKANKIDIVFIGNSAIGYESLPLIMEDNKNLTVIDLIHGEGGENEGGGFPKFSIPYDKYIDKRIASNKHLKDVLVQKYGIDEAKIQIIYNGIDLEKWKKKDKINIYRNRFNIMEDDFLIVFIGRLSFDKNPEKIIKIGNILVNESGRKETKFIIAGDGPLYKDINEMINDFNLQNNIFLTGAINNPEQLLSESSILLLVSEMEGIPFAVLESMSMNVPVISSNVGGVPEIISNNVDGFLFPFDKNLETNIAKTIIKLQNEKTLYKQISNNVRNTIIKKFDMKIFKDKYVKLFK